MHQLLFHPAEPRGEFDPFQFPRAAVRPSIPRLKLTRDDALDSIQNVEAAFAEVERHMAKLKNLSDQPYWIFSTDPDGPNRAA
ncbi:MAG: hypothetical protein SFZ23_12525 [Planctomycetota bacterium]|nr:hypothetical protein [Planctomycetota bacterium]